MVEDTDSKAPNLKGIFIYGSLKALRKARAHNHHAKIKRVALTTIVISEVEKRHLDKRLAERFKHKLLDKYSCGDCGMNPIYRVIEGKPLGFEEAAVALLEESVLIENGNKNYLSNYYLVPIEMYILNY
ncbi:MAG TPA: hypothetical protein VJH20_02830 [Candidatus Nanoarchaeia archaeon]|nr:hypothetical protein [Candidatus Nanoarchaeia archaeon]